MADTPTSEYLKNQVIAECHKYIDIVNKTFDLNLKYPMITFDLNTTGAGKSLGVEHAIKFNPYFLVQNSDEFLKNTVPHEVAHLVEFVKYNTMGHGRQWKHIMWLFGVENCERCHHYDTVGLEVVKKNIQKIKYECKCGILLISKRRHNKIVKEDMMYRCKKCGTLITQKSEIWEQLNLGRQNER